MDRFLQEVCSSVSVDIMPGGKDPSGTIMPQEPLFSALFQSSREYSTFHNVTNPYWSCVDNVSILGTSGQTIDDIYKYVQSEDRLEMAKKTLIWGHMAPTAPDTLCKWQMEYGERVCCRGAQKEPVPFLTWIILP